MPQATPSAADSVDSGALPTQMSTQDFAGKVRAKYPGAYDSLSDDELTQKIVAKYPEYGQAVKSVPKPATPPAGAVSRFASGLAKTILPSTNFRDYYQGPISAIAHPLDFASNLKDMGSDLLHAQGDEFTKANTLAREGHGIEGLGHELAGFVPILGPAAARAGEQIGTGDVAGGMGSGAGLIGSVLAPRAIPKVVSAGADIASKSVPIIGKAASFASDVVSPDITGIFSPRLAHAQRVMGRVGKAMAGKPATPEYPGAPLPASPDTPLDGEYVNSNPIATPSSPQSAPFAPADIVEPPLLPEQASPARDLPYRRVSGEVEPEDVNTPNPRVLGRNKGIITTRKGLLGEGRPVSEPEPSEMPVYRPELSINRSNRVGRADAWEDKGIQDSLQRNMEAEPVRLQRQELEDTQDAYPRAFRGPKFSISSPTDLTGQLQASVDHVRDTKLYQQAGKELGQNAPIRDILQRAQQLKEALNLK